MKATLSFTLPEERYEYDCANKGTEYRGCLTDFDEYMRGIVKYGNVNPPDNVTPDAWAASVDAVREALHVYLSERDLIL